MRVAVKSNASPVYKKNTIASLLCIFETTIVLPNNVYLILAFIISIISQASDHLIITLAFIVYTGTNMHM